MHSKEMETWVTSTPATEEQTTPHPDKVGTAIKQRGSPTSHPTQALNPPTPTIPPSR